MIAPEFRNYKPGNLKALLKNFIEKNHGTDLAISLQPQINQIQSIREELVFANQYGSDVEQLKKFQNLFGKNYQNAMLLNRYFTFGNGNGQINVQNQWFDSFNQASVAGHSPILDALSSKYNYGVSLARQACFMNLEGDGIKMASKYMQMAAWVFEDLKTNVSQLKPGETSADFTCEALSCLSYLMLAQAQYLFYKMASDKKMAPELLSKIALQISSYFSQAYEMSQTNTAIKKFQNGKWANVLAYHSKYFEASAWQVLAVHRFQKAKEDGKDMGIAAGTAIQARKLFEQCQDTVNLIGPTYSENYQNKLKQAASLEKMALDKAKTVFFEAVPAPEKIPMPDQKNFVKFEEKECKAELEAIPVMNETLRHIVPPQVRTMQTEFKTHVQNLIDQQYKNIEKSEQEERVFLGQYQLPQSFHELTAVGAIPDSITNKVEDFQKKGAVSNFTNIIDSIGGLRHNCDLMINECEKILNEEESFDNGMREAYGAAWNVLDSKGLNQPYRAQISTYRDKMAIAKTQDDQTIQRFHAQKNELTILTKTKQELIDMMPVSEQAQMVSEKPTAIAIKDALTNIENAQKKKSDILAEAVQNLANLNIVEQLMEVHTGKSTKDAVFTAQKEQFNTMFASCGKEDDLIKSSNKVIQEGMGDFNKLKQSIAVDPARQTFFQQIDLALMCQTDIENILGQGSQFYSRLCEHLTNLKQNISDFKMSRRMQMDETCKKLGAQNMPVSSDQPSIPFQGGPPQGGQPQGGAPFQFEVFQPPAE